jgi:hypothetical protein
VRPADLLALLQELYRDKLALMLRHQTGARQVGRYSFNNTYQYIIAREEVQLTWLRDAIESLGGVAPDQGDAPQPPARGRGADAATATLDDDVARERAFVDRWRERIEAVTNARHRGMLRVILGEALEHTRFFEQALAGRDDLLGRPKEGAGARGQVLPTRWIE